MTRVRSKSELDELKDEFDREDVEHKGEISGESVGRMLRKSKSRVVKRVLSGGKFGVSDIQMLAKIRDVNNSHTSSFKELVEVLHAADNITDEEGKSEGKQQFIDKNTNDHDEWEKAEKRYTKSAIERHHRRSSAGRSIKVAAVEQQQQEKKIDQAVEKNDIKQEKKELNEDEAVDRIIRGVPHPKQNQAADCACACVLM